MWKDKVVIITGSSIGIGFELAKEIANKGAIVILNSSNPQRLEKANTKLSALGFTTTAIACDVTSYASCLSLVEKTINSYGKIDVVINNAGISSEGSISESHHEVFKRVIDVNLIGAFNMTKATLPYLKKQGGNILFIGSVAGIHGLGNYAAYSSSKMALTGLAESLKIELHNTNVHVGIAYLGFIENSKEKTILSANNERIPQPERKNVSKMSPEKISKKLILMIEKNTFKRFFSPIGKVAFVLNRIAPGLLRLVLTRIHQRQNF